MLRTVADGDLKSEIKSRSSTAGHEPSMIQQPIAVPCVHRRLPRRPRALCARTWKTGQQQSLEIEKSRAMKRCAKLQPMAPACTSTDNSVSTAAIFTRGMDDAGQSTREAAQGGGDGMGSRQQAARNRRNRGGVGALYCVSATGSVCEASLVMQPICCNERLQSTAVMVVMMMLTA